VTAKAREILRREHEQNLRENAYWLSSLELVYSHGLDPLVLQEFDRRVGSITPVNLRELARTVLDPGRYVRVVLMPEEGA